MECEFYLNGIYFYRAETEADAEGGDNEESILTEEDLIEEDQAVVDYNAGCYSPKLVSPSNLDIDAVIYDPEDDMKKLELARKQVLSFGKVRVCIYSPVFILSKSHGWVSAYDSKIELPKAF